MPLAARESRPFAAEARDGFGPFEEDPERARAPWLAPLRRAAIARFLDLGLPTTREEEWRFTNVAPIEATAFRLPSPKDATGPVEAARRRVLLGATDAFRIVFLNGRFSKDLSDARGLPPGVRLGSLGAALETDRDVVEAHLGRYAPYADRAFTALNTAFLEDGAFLSVP